MDVTRKLIVIGSLLLATLVTGIWLGQLEKPLNPTLSGIHKLLALAWVIYSAIVIYHAARPIESRAAYFAALAVLAISMVALIASGSVLTVPKSANTTWLTVHRIVSALAVIASWIAARLIILNKP